MRVDILTLFPGMFSGYLNESMLKRAQERGQLTVFLHDIRDHATGKHRLTDEPPYGGGGGMVLKPGPIFAAVEAIEKETELAERPGTAETVVDGGRKREAQQGNHPVILLTPQGRAFDQRLARELSDQEHLILICGRYEGVDERVRQHLASDEISIGDYVLTGGELAAMVVVDAVARLLPGVLGAQDAAASDSHATGLLEGPHYTRPETFRGWQVPEVLRSGHDANIKLWRRQQALRRTWQRRPDLLLRVELSEADKWFLMTLAGEERDHLPG
jgi:tRNA (guanine37-N1)-methyltransferase